MTTWRFIVVIVIILGGLTVAPPSFGRAGAAEPDAPTRPNRDQLLIQPGVYGTYTVFKVDADWWKLDPAARRSAAKEIKTVFQRHAEKVVVDTYLLRGLSDHGDLMVRVHSTDLIDNQNFLLEVMGTTLGRHLETTYTFLGLTKKPNYVPRFPDEMQQGLKSTKPEAGFRPYAIVIPIRKDAEWWNLAEEERAKLMQEHTDATLPYLKTVNRKLYHATGLDDFDFLTYFETAKLEDFNNLVIGLMKVKENRHNRRFGHPILIGAVKSLDEVLQVLAR